MSVSHSSRPLLTAIAVIGIWVAAGLLSASLAALPEYRARSGDSVMRQLFGKSTVALGEYMFYGKADGFYHKGRQTVRETAFTNSLFQVLRSQIVPVGHTHLSGDETKDMAAWIRFAITLDPANVDYYLAASYWLGRELDRPDLALQVLEQAQENNPDSYLAHMGLGRFYAHAGDRRAAEREYAEAVRLWPSDADREDDEIRQHKRESLARLALLAELADNTDLAIARMNEIVRAFPRRSALFSQRISVLRSGDKLVESAERRWNTVRRTQYEHFCTQETDGHDHDSTQDHEGHAH